MKDLKSKAPAGSAGKGIWVCTWSVLSLMALHLCWMSFRLFYTCCCSPCKSQIDNTDADYVRPFFFRAESKRFSCYCGYKFLTEAAANLGLRQVQCFSGLFPCGTTATVVKAMTFTADSPPLEPNSTFWLPQSTSCCGCWLRVLIMWYQRETRWTARLDFNVYCVQLLCETSSCQIWCECGAKKKMQMFHNTGQRIY